MRVKKGFQKKGILFAVISIIIAACVFAPARPAKADSWLGADKGEHLMISTGLTLAGAELLYSIHKNDLLREKFAASQLGWLPSEKWANNSVKLTEKEKNGLKVQSILENAVFIFGISIIKETIDRSQGKEFSWKDVTYAMGGNLIMSVPFYYFADIPDKQ